MAIHNKDQYDKARAAAAAGSATKEQLDAVAREAKQAGGRGSKAREALK